MCLYMKFHHITVATKPHPVLEILQNTVVSKGETLTVLGQEENRSIGWDATGNFGVKLKAVRDFVLRSDLKDDDLVLFTDAYDVIYYGNREQITHRYFKFSKPIVFGCEKYCNPVPSYEKYYPNTNHEFRFLNSGMFIGRVWALRKCIEKYEYEDRHDDQLFWTIQFLKENCDLIQLDYDNTLFFNSAGVPLADIEVNDTSCKYKSTEPLFVHVNGPDKKDLKYFLPQLE
jgi:hypothetical protein